MPRSDLRYRHLFPDSLVESLASIIGPWQEGG